MGKFATVLVNGTREEEFKNVLVSEGGVIGFDPRVQNADENPLSWWGIRAELQFQIRVGFRSADRFETPLQLNGGIFRISRSFFGGKLPELLVLEAASLEGGDTRGQRGACRQPNGHQGKRDEQAGK